MTYIQATMTQTIFITGGAGFIGSTVVRHIINNTNDSLMNIDKLTYAGNIESLASIFTPTMRSNLGTVRFVNQ